MEDSSSPGTSGFLARAREYHHRESLSPEEYEALMELGAELVQPSTYDDQCFVLGSYDSGEKQRLEYVCQSIDGWSSGNHRAYLMEEFTDDLHPIVEFRLIADYSDHVIGVFEHDQGGFQFELGMLILIDEYRDRSTILKRTYPSENEEHDKYNWMLDRGRSTCSITTTTCGSGPIRRSSNPKSTSC